MNVSHGTHKHWVFTTFVLTLLEQLPVLAEREDVKLKYCCCQVERCPETQREHIQGYVEFADQIGLRTVKLRLGDPTMHLEPRRGTGAQFCHGMIAWPSFTPVQEHEKKHVTTPVKKKRASVGPTSLAPLKKARKAVDPISSDSETPSSPERPTVNSSSLFLESTSSISEYVRFLRFYSSGACDCFVCERDRCALDDGCETLFERWRHSAWYGHFACYDYWRVHGGQCCGWGRITDETDSEIE